MFIFADTGGGFIQFPRTYWLRSVQLTLCDFGHDLVIWRKILKILKDSYNPRLKSVVFDRWFDMFIDKPINGHWDKFLPSNEILAVSKFGEQSCSVTSTTNSECLCYQDSKLMLEISSNLHKLGAPVHRSWNSYVPLLW